MWWGRAVGRHLGAGGLEVLTNSRTAGATVSADLTDADQVHRTLEQLKPAVILNLAALTNVEECERHPQNAYRVNVRIVENLAKWVRLHSDSCHLVQLSTDQVYDGPGPHQEDDVRPTNYYGFSKYAGELVAATASSTVLRTNFFGRSQCPSRTSLSDWVAESLVQKRPITVFDDVRFSPLTLQSLVDLVNLVIVKRQPGVFNLGSKNGMSKADFAFMFAEVLGLSTEYVKRGTSDMAELVAYRPKDMSMDSSRF